MRDLQQNLPIAVFDSGLGGLTVLKVLAQRFPQENFLYLGDTARLPYGSKSATTIRKYLNQNIAYLKSKQVKAIVIACNSASSVIIGEKFDSTIPIYNVIQPGALKALDVTRNKKIGVIGTRATVKGKAYAGEILRLEPLAEVFQQACPLFVPLVEEGWTDDPITNLIAYRYIQPLVQTGIDTLILGCTHYPILRDTIQKVTGSGIQLVDSAVTVSELIKSDMDDHVILPSSLTERQIHIHTTDVADHFQTIANQIMSPLSISRLELVDL